jgi:hypothetical protein
LYIERSRLSSYGRTALECGIRLKFSLHLGSTLEILNTADADH